MARSLVDTNILVYSRDLNEPVKRVRAIEVIDQLRGSGELVLSAQCINEFSSTSLRRGTPIVLGCPHLGHRTRRWRARRPF